MKRRLLAVSLILAIIVSMIAPLAAFANGRGHDPRPEPQPEPGKNNSRFWGGVAVGALVGAGLYYVLSDNEKCPDKAAPAAAPEPKPELPPAVQPAPPAPPAISKPKPVARAPERLKCEPPPAAKPKPVTRVGLEAQPDGVVAAVWRYAW